MNDNIYPKIKAANIVDLFFQQAKKNRDNVCIHHKINGKYHAKSWKEMNGLIEYIASYMINSGVKPGDKIAIFSFNRYEWWIADMASLAIGAVVVPIYPTNSFEEAEFVIKDADIKWCFTGDASQSKIVSEINKSYKNIKQIISFDDHVKSNQLISFNDAIESGKQKRQEKKIYSITEKIKAKDIATIIYTSGTTGNPKGVMLSHGNIFSNVLQLMDVFGPFVDQSEVFLSFLPLSHALERTTGYYTPIAIGCSVAFGESYKTIQNDMIEVSPTVIISVPRLYEKIHSGILNEVSSFPLAKKLVFKWAMRTGTRNLPYICAAKEPTGLHAKSMALAEKLVFSKIKKALGMDRLKVAISGGSPLSFSDITFFLSMGINVYEGYGMTEASPVIAVNKPGNIKPGTVGPAMIKTEVKLSDEGEILVKGPQVMAGYYKNKEATKEAFDKNGYLKTGDIGILDETGHITITGRIKDIIVTAGGKNISPQNIESKLLSSKFIEQIAIIGDKKKYLVCLIVPNRAEIFNYAKRMDIKYESMDDLLKNKTVNDLFENEISVHTKHLSRVEQIKKFKLINSEWSQASGELTPTLKVKRKIIEEKYKNEIEEMYL